MNRREQLVARAREGFRMTFGADPTRFYAAPGRVNLIGEHVDSTARRLSHWGLATQVKSAP